MSAPTLAAARAEADRARARLLERAHEVQARLKPAAVVEQVRTEIRRNAESGAERVVAEARKRPVAMGIAAAGLAALIAAPPLLRLARSPKDKDRGRGPRDGDDDDGGQARGEARREGRRGRGRDR